MHANAESELHTAAQDRIRTIAAEVFQTDAARIELKMGPEDIEQWDSLNHLRLITEVEAAFSIHLTMQQIQGIESLQDLANFVAQGAS